MQHPHAVLLSKLYHALSEGNPQLLLDACAPQMTFQIAGKSPLAGKYTKENFISGLIAQQKARSDGTYQLEVHDILASDLHATVLGTSKVTRGGKTTELRTVHVWRFDQGMPVAGYEYPRDLYQFDAIWSL